MHCLALNIIDLKGQQRQPIFLMLTHASNGVTNTLYAFTFMMGRQNNPFTLIFLTAFSTQRIGYEVILNFVWFFPLFLQYFLNAAAYLEVNCTFLQILK